MKAIPIVPAVLVTSLAAAATAAAQPVDLALVVAVDVSSSVNAEEYALQRDGTAQAFVDEQVVAAIQNGMTGCIAASVVEWHSVQAITVPWRVICDEEDALALATEIAATERSGYGLTGIGDAILFSLAHLEACPCRPERQVIDLSGDGRTNVGAPATAGRDAAWEVGVTVNGLAILTQQEPRLKDYYQENVIIGFGSFVHVAEGFEDFARAMRSKLRMEIAAVMD